MERKINRNGSITIPSNLRRNLGIEGREKINIEVQNNGDIIIKRIQGTCIFCNSVDDVQAFKGKFVCSDCREKLGK